jgi:hypothetical protein
VYGYLRRKGLDPHAAQDQTQDFFAELVESNWLAGVARRKTRFSTLLLTVVNRRLVDAHRRETAAKRGGGKAILSLDTMEAERWFGAEPSGGETPEEAFERRFAQAALASALGQMRKAYILADRGEMFERLAPYLSQEPAPGDFERLAQATGGSRSSIASAVARLRRDYRDFVRQEVAAGLVDKSRVDEEMRNLALALGRG